MKKMHKCEICPYTSTDKSNFNKHRKAHYKDSITGRKKTNLHGDFSCHLHKAPINCTKRVELNIHLSIVHANTAEAKMKLMGYHKM
jgi:hypothetical protein